MSWGVCVQGVSVQGVSDLGVCVLGVCVLGVSVQGVHVRGGFVLSPYIYIYMYGEKRPDFSNSGYRVSAPVCTLQPWPSCLFGLHSCLEIGVVWLGSAHFICER